MESVLQATMEEMREDFQKRMAAFESNLQKSTPISSGPSELALEFSQYRDFITQAMKLLQQQIEALAQSVDAIEMQKRRKMLMFHGVAEVPEENTTELITKILKSQMGLADFSAGDIKRCHRMGQSSSTKKPRPILVKLQDLDTRDTIWYNKTKLKGSGVTLSEFLTKPRHDLFMAARDKFGVTKCWTKGGNVHVLNSGVRHRVTSFSQLNAIPVSADTAKPAPAAKANPAPKTRRAATSAKK